MNRKAILDNGIINNEFNQNNETKGLRYDRKL